MFPVELWTLSTVGVGHVITARLRQCVSPIEACSHDSLLTPGSFLTISLVLIAGIGIRNTFKLRRSCASLSKFSRPVPQPSDFLLSCSLRLSVLIDKPG